LFENGFIPEADKKALAAGSGVLVLPYRDHFVEVSGVVHDFCGYGVALICSETPRFAELRSGFDCLKVGVTALELGTMLSSLLRDVERRENLARNLSSMAKDESWTSVGELRLRIYNHH
jgi:hypothetical protein